MIKRLRNFSPSQYNTSLTATYQADKEALKTEIEGLKSEHKKQSQVEEFYKERIRKLQLDNIQAHRSNEQLLSQTQELGNFFKFLYRCRKRLKKVLSQLSGSTSHKTGNEAIHSDKRQQAKQARSKTSNQHS